MRQNSKCRGSDRSTPHIGRTKSHVPGDDAGTRADVNENQLYWNSFVEGWQNGYCTGLENRRPKGLGGSNPSPSVSKSGGIASAFGASSRVTLELLEIWKPVVVEVNDLAVKPCARNTEASNRLNEMR